MDGSPWVSRAKETRGGGGGLHLSKFVRGTFQQLQTQNCKTNMPHKIPVIWHFLLDNRRKIL